MPWLGLPSRTLTPPTPHPPAPARPPSSLIQTPWGAARGWPAWAVARGGRGRPKMARGLPKTKWAALLPHWNAEFHGEPLISFLSPPSSPLRSLNPLHQQPCGTCDARARGARAARGAKRAQKAPIRGRAGGARGPHRGASCLWRDAGGAGGDSEPAWGGVSRGVPRRGAARRKGGGPKLPAIWGAFPRSRRAPRGVACARPAAI